MYLKSLILKGFKSFADRTVLELEPGMTVVVGPNGSGKSNVTDAMLWVLGEQSAKHLRGQTMEDVIFSGSSARSPVGMAEVDLVLDNSDHKLAIEYDEVSLTRRMYRSGESEYLLNGTPCLLRDIQDILHDSGIGRGAHSIISQGTLTQVLEARDEDRRGLIEEAAGILKHKRRKERAARKMASMDVTLERVRDVLKEIQRQLKPLERQAKRAQQYEALASEASDIGLAIAVDDLRRLQSSYETLDKREREVLAQRDIAQMEHEKADEELERLQRALAQRGLFVGNIVEQQTRCQTVRERLSADATLLRERGGNMRTRSRDLHATVESSDAQLSAIREEHDTLTEEQQADAARLAEIEGIQAELKRDSERLRDQRRESDREYQRMSAELREHQRAVESCRLRIDQSNNATAADRATDEMLRNRLARIDEQHETSTGMLASQRLKLDDLTAQLTQLRRDGEQVTHATGELTSKLDACRRSLKEARDRHADTAARIRGLEQVDRAFEQSNPALSWALEHHDELDVRLRPIADMLEVPDELKALVEHLMGEDLSGLAADDAESAELLATALLKACDSGELSLVPVSDVRPPSGAYPKAGRRLLDEIGCHEGDQAALSALLGDVWLVGSLDEAIAAHEGNEGPWRFVTPEGACVWPSGKITLGKRESGSDGMLARRQELARLGILVKDQESDVAACEEAVEEAEAGLQTSREEGLAVSRKIASTAGEVESLKAEIVRLEQVLESLKAERTQIDAQRDQIEKRKQAAQPLVEEMKQRIEKLDAQIADVSERIRRSGDARSSRIAEENDIRERLSNINVEKASLTSRARYLSQRLSQLETQRVKLKGSAERAQAELRALDGCMGRVDPLAQTLSSLTDSIDGWLSKLRDRAALEQADSQTLIETIETARETVRAAKATLDEHAAAAADVRVEKGKIETQVEAAVRGIVEDYGVILDVALETPPLEDRSVAEARLARLNAKIDKIGAVNQVATEEYEALKARRDYIAGQVEDLENASKSLAKIIRAIDAKMRSRFLATFESVDASFQEVFSKLFPGGSAHLSLTNPDSPETSGVAVWAQPVGKRIAKMTLMSGGEKSLTAVALLFAVYKTRTVPFYVLDEIDTALDDTNLRRLVMCLDEMRHETQFIIVTHARRTMEMADVLYGVSMQADGVSKVISQKLERIDASAAEGATPQQVQEAIDTRGEISRAATTNR